MTNLFRVFLFVLFALIHLGCTKKITSIHLSNGKYILQSNEIKVEIDPIIGGRIVSYKFGDTDVLLPKTIHSENYGSTLWPSPQNWPWPPSSVLDRMEYASHIQHDTLNLISNPDVDMGLRFSKMFWIDKKKKALMINYTITNISNRIISVGAWEVTRVPFGGISFYPTDSASHSTTSNLIPTAKKNGITWFKHDKSNVEKAQKHFGSSHLGWLAHVNQGLILIKTFPNLDTTQTARGQGEVEIYTNENQTYIELENHGTYTVLKPSESLYYPVTWFLQPFKPTINTEMGSEDLVNSVKEIITH